MEIKRNPFLVFIILLMFLSLFGSSSKEPGRYYDKGFSIKFPEGWEKIESNVSRPGLVVNMKDPEDVAMIAIFLAEYKQEVIYEEYIKEHLLRLKSLGIDVNEEEATTIDGSKAYRVIFSSETPYPNTTLSYTIIKENKVYGVGCTVHDPNLFSSYKDTFQEIVSSFRFE